MKFQAALFWFTAALMTSPAFAQLEFTTEYGIEFSRIGDVGNIPFAGGPEDTLQLGFLQGSINGRGSVGYEYRISTNEVNSADYLEFFNTFGTQSDELAELLDPGLSSLGRELFYSGPGERLEFRSGIPMPERAPVSMTWRQAAMYVNWLHNGKSSDPSAIANGAYDISTFTRNSDGTFNDQPKRHPDAKFWIPSLDEYIKAVHYDPDKNGQEPGWWLFPHSSDERAVPGLPGEGETIRGISDEEIEDFWGMGDLAGARSLFPTGLYPETQSPWGLIDVLGGTDEYVEGYAESELLGPMFDNRFRLVNEIDNILRSTGINMYNPDGGDANEFAWAFRERSPDSFAAGLRIAAAVPSPATFACGVVSCLFFFRRIR